MYILLSTFNGEKFLNELLLSLKNQSYRNFEIVVRDDGSTDQTLEILESYQKSNSDFFVYKGVNLGVQASFLELTKLRNDNEGLFCFCDQDDIWHPNKLKNAIEKIPPESKSSTLYFCNQEYIDSNGLELGCSPPIRTIGLNNAITENIAVGCTQVFGNQLRSIFSKSNPNNMIMHDWWMYLIATCYGRLVYDKRPLIKYRQHKETFTPFEPGLIKVLNRLKYFIYRFLKGQHKGLDSFSQIKYFMRSFSDMPQEKRQQLEMAIQLKKKNVFSRVKIFYSLRLQRNKKIETFSLFLIILFNLQ